MLYTKDGDPDYVNMVSELSKKLDIMTSSHKASIESISEYFDTVLVPKIIPDEKSMICNLHLLYCELSTQSYNDMITSLYDLLKRSPQLFDAWKTRFIKSLEEEYRRYPDYLPSDKKKEKIVGMFKYHILNRSC